MKSRTYVDQKNQNVLQISKVKELILQIVSHAIQKLQLRLEPVQVVTMGKCNEKRSEITNAK